MPNLASSLTIVTVLLFTSLHCTKRQLTRNLDHYGAFENMEITITFDGIGDSCNFYLRSHQELYGSIEIDTTINLQGRGVTFTKKFTLERPSIFYLRINYLEKEIFLIPESNNNFHLGFDSSNLTITFEEEEIQKINNYCEEKAAFGGDILLRSLVTRVNTLPTLGQVYDSVQALESQLNLILNQNDHLHDLPSWFVEYEKRNIKYLCLMIEAGAPRIRRILFDMQDTLQHSFELGNADFDVNDELAMTTPHYLSSLPKFIKIDPDSVDIYDLEPVTRMETFLRRSDLIRNERIRDVYKSYLFYTMQRSSHYFPDTLISKVRSGISVEMQPYLNWIEKQYGQLNGVQAPAIHLLDTNDSLVSLSDFKDNLILLDFWFVGCKFCKLENPHTQDLIEKFQDKDFVVLQVCMKSDRETWEDLRGDFVGIPLYSNEQWNRKLQRSYKISGYPRYVLIDEKGIVLEGWCERPSDPALAARISDHFVARNNQ